MRIYYYLLKYLKPGHKLFLICKEFEPGKFAIKAVNCLGTNETVIAECRTRKLAIEIITEDLNGKVIPDA